MPEIRTLGPDEKITEPGFYAISLERHHAQPCDGPSVTSGILRRMELASPADVWAFHALNPNRWPDKPQTAALRMGVAMALYCEGGPERVLEKFRVHPKDKPRKPTEAQITAYGEGRASEAALASVEYWMAVETAQSEWLDQSEFDLICTMGKVLEADVTTATMLDGIPEVTMATRDARTGLWLLSRPDVVNFDGTAVDYKKVNTQGRPFSWRVVDARITEHGYDMQMAFAADAFEELTGERPGAVGIVAQWDQPPHHIILREISDEDLRFGSFRNRRAIDRFAECLESGHWPGPGDDVGVYQRPDWLRERLLEEMQMENTAP